MGVIDKAKELSGQAVGQVVEKVGDLGGDDLMANTIMRGAEKQRRVNAILEEKGCEYRICGFEVENSIPPKIVFAVSRDSE